MITRRTFMGTLGAATVKASHPVIAGPVVPKKIAIVTTIWTYLSHAQHMGDRFLVGYPRNGRWHRPSLEVVSLYVDQKPEGDLSSQRARQLGFTIYPTIAEALR